MNFLSTKRASLRHYITFTAGSALIVISAILIVYAEIRTTVRVNQQQAAMHVVKTGLVETALALKHERLSALARNIASDGQVDIELSGGFSNLEKVLDIARANQQIALVVTAASGNILARSADRSVAIDSSLFSGTKIAISKTQLMIGLDGIPFLLHQTPIRRGDQIVGVVWVKLSITNVVDEFFPDLSGLAFRTADGIIEQISGYHIDTTFVPANTKIGILSAEGRKHFETVFIPLSFGNNDQLGDLILLREITNAAIREKFLSRLTLVAVFVIILISLGLLTRALRLGLRPLGAIVHVLEAMSQGDTKMRVRHAQMPSLPESRKSIAQEGISKNLKPDENVSRNEIGTLLGAVESFRVGIDAQNTLIAVRAQLENARLIQESLLPRRFDLHPDFDIFGHMRPALEVAGDFFDVFKLGDGRLAVLIADVSGKGLAAALFAAQASALLRAHCHQTHEPDDAIHLANQVLCERNLEDMFVTCILAVIVPETGAVAFVNAGHCSPVVLRADGKVEQIITQPDPILGIVSDFTWKRHHFNLAPGDRFLFYSDGFSEAQTQTGAMLGTEKVIKMFSSARCAKELSSKQVSSCLFDAVDGFAVGVPQTDDITIITVRFLN